MQTPPPPPQSQASPAPGTPGEGRPFWSVMIPVYNPDERYLTLAIDSVLDQDPGEAQLQICVVDDASPKVDVEAIVRKVGRGRVEYFRQPANVGLAGNWNEGISRARGEWVHLLHQDDVVLPGFYAKLGAGLRSAPPSVGMGLTRYCFIDPDGHWLHLSELLQREAGVLPTFRERIASGNVVQFAAFVVRRDAYLEAEGFGNKLVYMLDWEMWVRLGVRHDVWYEPEILACYRRHPGSETNRLMRSGRAFDDLIEGYAAIRENLPADLRERTSAAARKAIAGDGALCASVLAENGHPWLGRRILLRCFGMTRNWRYLLSLARSFRAPRGAAR